MRPAPRLPCESVPSFQKRQPPAFLLKIAVLSLSWWPLVLTSISHNPYSCRSTISLKPKPLGKMESCITAASPRPVGISSLYTNSSIFRARRALQIPPRLLPNRGSCKQSRSRHSSGTDGKAKRTTRRLSSSRSPTRCPGAGKPYRQVLSVFGKIQTCLVGIKMFGP